MAGEEIEVIEVGDMPWDKCVMGCSPPQDSEIILLRCLHTFCSEACVVKRKAELNNNESSLHCKICKFTIHPNDLKRKVVLSKIFLKKPTVEDVDLKMKCGFCILNRPAESYCAECPDYLCKECNAIHPQTKMTFQHKPSFNLAERRIIELELLQAAVRQCKEHKKELTRFCLACQKKMCDKCVESGTHDRSHDVRSIEEERKKLKAKVQVSSTLANKADQAFSTLMEKHIMLLNADWFAFQQKVDDEILGLLKLVYERAKFLKTEGKKMFDHQLVAIRLKQRRLKCAKQNTMEYNRTVAKVLERLDEAASVNFSALAENLLESFTRQTQLIDSEHDRFVEKDFHFLLKDTNTSEVQEVLKKFGTINYDVDRDYKSQPLRSAVVEANKLLPRRQTIPPLHKAQKEAPTTSTSVEKQLDSVGRMEGVGFAYVGNNAEQYAFKPRGIAKKSTGGVFAPGPSPGRSLGMPHLEHRKQSIATPSHILLPPPPKISRGKPALKTYSSASQRANQAGTSAKSGATPLPSTSRGNVATPSSEPTKPQKASSNEPTGVNDDPEIMEIVEVTSTSVQNNSKEKEDADFAPELTSSSELVEKSGGESSGSIEKVNEAEDNVLDNRDAPTLSAGNLTEENGEARPVLSQSSSREQAEDPQMPALDVIEPLETNEARLVDNSNLDIRIKARQDIESPTSSNSETSSGRTPVRAGSRSRKKKVLPDYYVDSAQIRFNRKDDRVDGHKSSANNSRMRRKSCSGVSDLARSSEPAPKIPRIIQVDEDDDERSSVATIKVPPSEISFPPTSETGSENGFGYESGSESSFSVSGRRLSLRARRQPQAASADSPVTSVAIKKEKQSKAEVTDPSELPEAPMESMETLPLWCDYPLQGTFDKMKTSEDDNNDDYCCICLDGGEDVIVCCDVCPKVFHLKCHMPILKEVPGDDEDDDNNWQCNYDKSKQDIDKEIAELGGKPGSENQPLTDANPGHFLLACKFMIEVYKIKEVPTIKWKFPELYWEKYGKVPYHLKFLREKLCLPTEKNIEPFGSVREYMLAFKQMFSQAFMVYQKKTVERKCAAECFRKFKSLVRQYYREYDEIFIGVYH